MVAFALIVGPGLVARGDATDAGDDVIAANITINAVVGIPISVPYRIIQGKGGDIGPVCNASDGTPATLGLITPSNVTASPTSLIFSACATGPTDTTNDQSTSFTASAPGSYRIDLSITDQGSASVYRDSALDPVNCPVGKDPTFLSGCQDVRGAYYIHGVVTLHVAAHPTSNVSGSKYLDANTNGQRDAAETGIGGWLINVAGDASQQITTNSSGGFSIALPPGTYTFTEVQATNFTQTGNTVDQSFASGGATVNLANFVYTVTIPASGSASEVAHLEFGNICHPNGGGRTPGFWQNKNGQKLIGPDDLQLLVGLNLVNEDGTPFDPSGPTAKEQVKAWILADAGSNMAYKLSSQLAAMALNVNNGFVDGSSQIFVDPLVDADGIATVNEVIALADAELAANPLTPPGDPDRAYQEALKNALDAANNNQNFVPDSLHPCAAPVFSSHTTSSSVAGAVTKAKKGHRGKGKGKKGRRR